MGSEHATAAGSGRKMKAAGAVRMVALQAAVAAALWASAPAAQAGGTINFGDDSSVSVGFGLRTSFTSDKDGAPNGTSRSEDFQLESIRLYLSGQYGKIIGATFNTERAADDSMRIMDAIARFEFMPEFNLWVGRMLPPSDRANLDGPYYLMAWSYPGVVSNYPNYAVGRDNGVTVWGKPIEGKLVYSLGIFNGHNRAATSSNNGDKLLYAGRLAWNIWDPEPDPAYYTASAYYGSNDIFTIAIDGMMQGDGVGTALSKGDYKAWSADLLLEKKFEVGVPTLEAAYYDYDLDGVVDCGSGEPGAAVCPGGSNIGGQVAGHAYLISGAFLFPTKFGWGQFQPYVRYQQFDRKVSDTKADALDFGINYIIKPYNAKVTAVYTHTEDERLAPGAQDGNEFKLAVQLQY